MVVSISKSHYMYPMIMTSMHRLHEEVIAPFDKFVHTSQRLSKIICFGSFQLSSSASDGNIQIIKFLG